MEEKLIGKITHFYGRPSAAMIELSDVLKVGDTIHIKGNASDLTQQVSSMQLDFKDVSEAKVGDLVGVKVEQKVHQHDLVYKVM